VVVLVASRDGGVDPTDEPSSTETPSPPPRALFGRPGERLAPGTYVIDEVEGSPTAPIFVTIGDGWTNFDDWAILNDDISGGFNLARTSSVYLDACHWGDGAYTGDVTTFEGLATALAEQGGWADVTTPADIAVDGYVGKAFQRTAPNDFSDCSSATVGRFRSMRSPDGGLTYYEPGEIETVWVLDLDGTVVLVSARMAPGQPSAAHAELGAVLDSLRIGVG
jgi:hypothetical protein